MMELAVEPHCAARAREGGLGPHHIGRTPQKSCRSFDDLILVGTGTGTQTRPAPGAPHPLPEQVSGYGALAEIVAPGEAAVVSPTQARARRRPR